MLAELGSEKQSDITRQEASKCPNSFWHFAKEHQTSYKSVLDESREILGVKGSKATILILVWRLQSITQAISAGKNAHAHYVQRSHRRSNITGDIDEYEPYDPSAQIHKPELIQRRRTFEQRRRSS